MMSDFHKTFWRTSSCSVNMIWDIKDNPILQDSSQEPSTSSQVWHRGWEVLDTLLIMLDGLNLAHNSRIIYCDDPWWQGWLHPPRLQSGTLCIHLIFLQIDIKFEKLLFASHSGRGARMRFLFSSALNSLQKFPGIWVISGIVGQNLKNINCFRLI